VVLFVRFENVIDHETVTHFFFFPCGLVSDSVSSVADGSHLPSARPLFMHRDKMEPTPWFLHNLHGSAHEDMAVSPTNAAN